MAWTSRSTTKVAVFLTLLAPAAWLARQLFAGNTGPNPVEYLEHGTGDWALRILLLTLAVSPIRKLTNWQRILVYRRMLGLFAFVYGVIHFAIYLWLDQGLDGSQILGDFYKRPYITAGLTALVLMLPLAVTSTQGMIRRLGGKRWQLLHRAVYVSATAAVIHYWWLVKSDIRLPLLYAAILVVLMAFRWRLVAGLFATALPMISQEAPGNLDLFLLIGQSNMAGRGTVEAQDKMPIPNVYALQKDDQWAPATDPLHWDKPIAGVGLGRSFARTVIGKIGGSVGLIPAAFGGTSLDEWKTGSPLFTEAVRRAKVAMKAGELRGILWHQGEADSGKRELAESYAERWKVMMKAMKAELGTPDVPVVVGELAHFLDPAKQPFAPEINRQLRLLPAQVASAEGLHDKGDQLHFDAASQREFGKRYAEAFLRAAKHFIP